MFTSYTHELRSINGLNIHCRIGGDGPPLLLLHGHPTSDHVFAEEPGPASDVDCAVHSAEACESRTT